MIVSACKDSMPRIGGVYRARYSFVAAGIGYSPGRLLKTSESPAVHLIGIWGETPRPLNYHIPNWIFLIHDMTSCR